MREIVLYHYYLAEKAALLGCTFRIKSITTDLVFSRGFSDAHPPLGIHKVDSFTRQATDCRQGGELYPTSGRRGLPRTEKVKIRIANEVVCILHLYLCCGWQQPQTDSWK